MGSPYTTICCGVEGWDACTTYSDICLYQPVHVPRHYQITPIIYMVHFDLLHDTPGMYSARISYRLH